MREFDLPSPGIGGMGHHIRRIAAKAISYIQVNAPAFGGTHPSASNLRAFFSACANALAPYDASPATENTVPVGSFTPAAASFSLAAGANQAGPVLDKGGSTGAVTYSSATPAKATVNAATGAITPVATGTSVITATIAAAPGYDAATVTYTATVTA